MPEFLAELARTVHEARILEGKRRRRFGPDQQVRMIAGRGQAELLDVVQVFRMVLIPRRRIVVDLGKIELHRASVVICMDGRYKSRSEQDRREQQYQRGYEHSNA